MIGKVPGTGSGFRGLVNYLMTGNRNQPDRDRVAWLEMRNLFVPDVDLAPRAMRATAVQSTRCKKPAYHMVISWHRDENPTEELMRTVGDRTLRDMNLSDHQAILVAHHDTDHKHLHLVINRVHPATTKAWHTGKDWERLEISLGRQARQHGLMFVPGRHNSKELYRGVSKAPRDSEFQMAARTKIEALARWSKEEIQSRRTQLGPIFEAARSWDQLSRRLATEGIGLERKGQGLVVRDATGYMKLSDLGKEVRLTVLEDLYQESFPDFVVRHRADAQRAMEALIVEGPATPRIPPQAKLPAAPKDRPNPPERSHTHDSKESSRKEREGEDAEREKLREEARQERIARRNAELEARSRQQKPATANTDEDSSPTDVTPARSSLTSGNSEAPPKSDKRIAHEALSEARATLQFAYTLYEAGFISRADVKAASAYVKRKEEELSRHQTLHEFIAQSVAEALTPKPKPPSKDTEELRRRKNRNLRKKREAERDDRER